MFLTRVRFPGVADNKKLNSSSADIDKENASTRVSLGENAGGLSVEIDSLLSVHAEYILCAV